MLETSSESLGAILPPEGATHDRLVGMIRDKLPNESVGLLTSDGIIIELTNKAPSPENSFEVDKLELLHWIEQLGTVEGLALWHSHPQGGIGPSRTDMQQRIPFLHHLIVSIVDDDVVYSFY